MHIEIIYDIIIIMNRLTVPDEMESNSVSKERIYEELRRAIIIGQRRSGSRLVVSEIAAHYQTSITPVRDALQKLSQEGLVTIKPRSGYFVTTLTLKQLRDLLDLRRILELAAVKAAAERITAEQLDELRNIHKGYSGEDDASKERYVDENRRFHTLIAAASGNMALAEAVQNLHERLARFMIAQHIGGFQIEAHNEMIQALEAHDPEKAYQAMSREVNPSQDAILETAIDDGAHQWRVMG